MDKIGKIIFSPGYILLFLLANFPTESGKNRNVARTGRQWKNRAFFAPVYSIIFYVFVYFYVTADKS